MLDSKLDQSVVSHILIDNKELLDHLPQVILSYVPRQTNRVAHNLASHGYESLVNQTWLYIAPDCVQDVIYSLCL